MRVPGTPAPSRSCEHSAVLKRTQRIPDGVLQWAADVPQFRFGRPMIHIDRAIAHQVQRVARVQMRLAAQRGIELEEGQTRAGKGAGHDGALEIPPQDPGAQAGRLAIFSKRPRVK